MSTQKLPFPVTIYTSSHRLQSLLVTGFCEAAMDISFVALAWQVADLQAAGFSAIGYMSMLTVRKQGTV